MTKLVRTRLALAFAGALLAAPLVAAPLGCGSGDAQPPAGSTTAASSAPAPTVAATATATAAPVDVVLGVPYPPEKIAKVVNPKNAARYTGPTGTLRGMVRIQGDPPPDVAVNLPSRPCRGEAAATHGKLFRVGQDSALADALVAVTGHGQYVPPKEPVEKLTIRGCSFARRTVALTYGQRIEIANLDKIDSYMPFLDGAPVKAILVAIPGGDAVKLYPHEPAHFMIRDQLPNEHLTADVYALAYSTHSVTGLDGKYEITGIPVGPVEVSAMLPATAKAKSQRLEIKEGDNTLDLTITYDAKTDKPKRGTTGAPRMDEPSPGDTKNDGAKEAAPTGAKKPGPKG
jgi:hypothetical protein